MRRDHDNYDLLYEGERITIKAYALVTGESFKAGKYYYHGPSIVWKSELPHGPEIREEYVNDPSIWAWFQAQLEMKNQLEDKLRDLGEEGFVESCYDVLRDRQDELINERESQQDKVDELSDREKVKDLVRSRVHKSIDLLWDLGLDSLAEKLSDFDHELSEELEELA